MPEQIAGLTWTGWKWVENLGMKNSENSNMIIFYAKTLIRTLEFSVVMRIDSLATMSSKLSQIFRDNVKL